MYIAGGKGFASGSGSLQAQADPCPSPVAPKGKNPRRCWATGVFWGNSLTMTYFHTGCSTIIGAKSFHGPVRDGKGWYQLAMVIRHDWSVPWRAAACISHTTGVSGNPNWKK